MPKKFPSRLFLPFYFLRLLFYILWSPVQFVVMNCRAVSYRYRELGNQKMKELVNDPLTGYELFVLVLRTLVPVLSLTPILVFFLWLALASLAGSGR